MSKFFDGGNMLKTFIIMIIAPLAFSSFIAHADDMQINPEHLKAYKHDLIDYYPQTVCLLKEMLGEEYNKLQDYERNSGLSSTQFDFEKDSDDVVSFRQYYQNSDNRILYAHPSGTVLLGMKRGKELIIYSNNRAIQRNIPWQVQEWIHVNQGNQQNISWHLPKTELIEFYKCSRETLSSEIVSYIDSKEVHQCKTENLKYMVFSQTPYIVATKKSRVPFLHSKRFNSTTTQNRYLISGDLVQLAEKNFEVASSDGYVCAFYQNKVGRIGLGWILLSDLKEIPGDDDTKLDEWLQQLPKIRWPNIALHRSNYPGRYKDDQEEFQGHFIIKDASTFKVTDISPKVSDTNIFKGHFINPRTLHSSEDSITATAYLFNNAVYVRASNEIVRIHHWGIYYLTQNTDAKY